GLVMDPDKVESVLTWKTPTNKSLLAGFIGTVSYLAPNCESIRIPMGILTARTGSTSIWRWGPTEQRAFENIKEIVQIHRNHHRKPIDYSPKAHPLNLIADASLTGGGGVLTQGDDPHSGNIIAFWSGKFSPGQQNYPVHERELLAIIVRATLEAERTSRRARIHFRIFTDHKPLEFLMSQFKLSARQHRWIDFLSDYDFTITYLPGKDNTVADALSRIYSDEPAGIQRSKSEYI
ncbi:hypothetical protein M422DRAFT_112334, partial [Sphaerobolus stellatus SS14]